MQIPLGLRPRALALLLTLPLLVLSSPSKLINARDDDDDLPGLHGNPTLRTTAHIAHGVTISTALILLFPLGAIQLRIFQIAPPRTFNAVSLHIYWQTFALFVLCVGFGLGCWLSYLHNELWDFGHEQMGTVICGLFLLQPVLGLVQHVRYARLADAETQGGARNPEPGSSWLARVHVWYGRSLIVLGAVCGGTGIQLAANWTVPQMLVYVVVTVVVAGFYIIVLWVWWGKGRGRRRLRLGTPSLEKLPLGLPGERLDLPGGLFGSGGSGRGSEERIVGEKS